MSARPLRQRLMPQSLVGRVIGILLFAVALVQGTSALLFFEERDKEVRSAKVANLVSRTASILRLLNITTPRMYSWITEKSTLTAQAQLDDQVQRIPRFAELSSTEQYDIRLVIDQEFP